MNYLSKIFAILLFAIPCSLQAQNFAEIVKAVASDGAANDWFGYSVSISGDYAIVGAYNNNDNGFRSGSAYIFKKDNGGVDNWGEIKKITASDGAASDYFGRSVSISGDYAIVGAFGDDDNGTSSGSAYIFKKDNGGVDNWGEIKKITASDGAADDYFGRVSISGDYAIIGADLDDDNGNNSGSAYIFKKDNGGVDNWGEIKKITASDGAAGDYFGYSVSISGDYAIVGAHGDNGVTTDVGSAYIFKKDNGGADNWGEIKKITASDGAPGDNFGISVSISGDHAIVGAHGDDDNGTNSGSAYIFKKDNGGVDNWGEIKKITASDGTAIDNFGRSVSMSGDYAIIGADWDGDNGINSGSAYIFKKDNGGVDNWGEIKKITASDGGEADHFGRSVSISGDYVIVGAYLDDDNGNNSGSAYIFTTPLYVDINATGANNGTSWANAYTDLQDAIDAAAVGHHIWVAAGTYHPTKDHTGNAAPTDPRDKTFHLSTDMKIYGGFAGTETLLSQRDAATNITTLSGDIDNATDPDVITGDGSTLSITGNAGNAYHVMITANLTAAAVIDGFTIKGGNAVIGGTFTYQTQLFLKNSGGGMLNSGSSPTIENIIFIHNNAAFGGGMDNDFSSSPIITNSTFTNNNANSGGGMYNYISSNPIITNSTFFNNNAISNGGGMQNEDASPSIVNSTFTNNNANLGGGMSNVNSSSPTITNSIFEYNNAISDGGGVNSISSIVTITNSTFAYNSADNNGGGIENSISSIVTITNSTFAYNSANGGGGMNIYDASATITNSTFANNSANFGGGVLNNNNSTLTITNTILWNNSQNSSNNIAGADINTISSTATVTYCLTQENSTYSSGAGIINNKDPFFVDAANDDYSLQVCSPAINTGTTVTHTTDILGNAFIGAVDMGAYEYQSASSPLVVLPKIFLEGAYAGGQMGDQLRAAGLVPLEEPYTTLGYTYVSCGEKTTTATVLAVTGNDAIVDWVIVELRDATTPTTVLATRAALLQKDGDVVDVDGVSAVSFRGMAADNYHVAIRHRNHLGIMSMNAIGLSSTAVMVDFTSPATMTYGTDARKDIGGVMCLHGGNVGGDGFTRATGPAFINDAAQILSRLGTFTNIVSTTYEVQDVNMDGTIRATGPSFINDSAKLLSFLGTFTNVRAEQLP